jgi:hypothetical protein
MTHVSLPRILRASGTALAVAFVLAAYVFFGSGGDLAFGPNENPEFGMYTSLAEGFRQGYVHLAAKPDPRLAALPFPYDFEARKGIDYWWDASYLNGRYYLYFTPVPVLFVYLPYHYKTQTYPVDAFVATVFAAWAFLAATGFARRALSHEGGAPQLPFALWVLLIGFANVTVFLLGEIRIYEVAILAGTAMTATWAWTLLIFVDEPTAPRAFWMSTWLALSIACRPNLGLLVFITAVVCLRVVKDRARLVRIAIAALVPLAIVGSGMIWYNVARFREPFEFGQSYMLTFAPNIGRRVCSLCNLPELARFVNNAIHYTFWAPVVRSTFPFVDLPFSSLDPSTKYPMTPEEVVGVAALIPVAMLGTFLAVTVILLRRGVDRRARTAGVVVASAWVILAGVATCAHVVSRYGMDFMVLMTAGTVVCVEWGLSAASAAGMRVMPARIGVALMAVYSIALGFLLGFAGRGGAFKRLHPELHEQIVTWLSGR